MAKRAQAHIIGSGIYLPEKVLSNQDLEKMVDTSDEWIVTRTGMKERRIAGSDEFASTMGAKAAQAVLENAKIDPAQIDLIAVATSTPDYLFPSTAALIQSAVGCVNAAVFDFQAACTGYLYGLSMAKAWVESGAYKRILLIASEKLSSFVDYTDRATCILFGDGAAAVVVADEGPGLSIEHVRLGSCGDQADIIKLPGGAGRCPPSHEAIDQGLHYIQMQGQPMFKHAVRRMEQVMQESLEETGLQQEQIRWLVPHQANIRIIQAIAKRFQIPMERVWLTVQKYGNTSASSVPLALHELQQEANLQPGDYLMCPAVGAGLTWGNAVLKQV